jgi:hypothetical protein
MEAFASFFKNLISYIKKKDSLDKKASGLMKWGIKSGKEMETWEQDIRYIGEEAVIDKGRERFSLMNRIMFSLIPVMRKMTKIVHLKFE